MFLTKLYNYYIHDMPRHYRQIKRQKRSIDPLAIVTIDEFIEKVAKPTAAGKGSLAELFREKGDVLEDYLFMKACHGFDFKSDLDIEFFPVKYEMMRESDKALMEEKYTVDPDNPNKGKMRTLGGFDLTVALSRVVGGYLEYDLRSDLSATLLAQNRRYPALYIENIFFQIDEITETHGEVDGCSLFSLVGGNGQEAVDFWRRVSDLRDYSGFFPDKPKPRGNNTRHDKEWSGVLNPAPVPVLANR